MKTKNEIFQQNGAPAHTAKIIKEWLDNCEISTIKDWSRQFTGYFCGGELMFCNEGQITRPWHLHALQAGKTISQMLGGLQAWDTLEFS